PTGGSGGYSSDGCFPYAVAGTTAAIERLWQGPGGLLRQVSVHPRPASKFPGGLVSNQPPVFMTEGSRICELTKSFDLLRPSGSAPRFFPYRSCQRKGVAIVCSGEPECLGSRAPANLAQDLGLRPRGTL